MAAGAVRRALISRGLVAAALIAAAAIDPVRPWRPVPTAAANSPSPGLAGAQSAEAAYLAKLDALIAPVRDLVPSPSDVERVKAALKLIGSKDAAAIRAQRGQISDPAARKLVEWSTLRAGTGEVSEFLAFLQANPAWPERSVLQRRAEEQLLSGGGSSDRIKAFFKSEEPRTGSGMAALASAFLAEGNTAEARRLAAKAWRDHELPVGFEAGFLDRFKSLLTEADHKRRLDRVLVDMVRLSSEREARASVARRILPLLSEPERRKAEARLAIFTRAKNAASLLAVLPAEPAGQTDWGLAYQKAQHYRGAGQTEAAWKILSSTPKDADALISPDDWWSERRAAAHEALRAGKNDSAYALVREGTGLSVNPLKEQQFMAGWIALRLLSKPDVALSHLESARTSADGPLSRARGEYWSGRAFEAVGRQAEAQKRYQAAAAIADTFHGQLARHKLQPGSAIALRFDPPALPTAEQAKRFAELDAVRAAVIATKAGIDRNIRLALFGHLRNHLETEAELAMLAHLAAALGDIQISLRVGKTGIARGMNLITYAYPLHAFPEFKPLRELPERAMLLAITRQETEFNAAIVSSAGARGLLQVMPITANHVCRDYKQKCDIPRLLTDNAYNAMIGSAYIADRMADFRGCYVLTLVAYNAGPGRARQWIREIGDPRDPAVDPIDWIEKIPFEETREYVKKVLSNVQIYRARLADPAALRLTQDLRRSGQGNAPKSRE
jgi:soluble lytic murein transglycosylase